jgi:hypothetical protein
LFGREQPSGNEPQNAGEGSKDGFELFFWVVAYAVIYHFPNVLSKELAFNELARVRSRLF